MRNIPVAAAIVILFCVVPVDVCADSTSIKKLIIEEYYKELPAGIEKLPWSEFKKHIDRYTTILSPEEVRELQNSMSGISLGRIGITRRSHPMGWEVIRVVPDGPAYWAGMRRGDILVGANDTSLAWADTQDTLSMVRGARGTPVLIDFMRNGRCYRTVIMRDDLHEDFLFCTVVGRTLAIRIVQFSPGLRQTFRAMTGHIKPETIDTLIIDLRDNPGGRVDATLDMLSEFVPHGDTIMASLERSGTEYSLSRPFGDWTDPRAIIVLQNDESASASELFAGALKVRCSAIIVGDTSYGKGRMQAVYHSVPERMNDDPSIGGFKFTSALYLAGGTLEVDGIGVLPDLTVEFPEPSPAELPDSFDIVGLRMAIAMPTAQDILRINAAGFGPVADIVWGDRASAYGAHRIVCQLGTRIPAPVWACTANHDSVPTAYSKHEEVAIRKVLATTYAGELADSILRLEPVERLLQYVNQRATIIAWDKRDEPEDPSRPNSDDLGIALDSIRGSLYVVGVYYGSAAYAAGVCIGDRITRLNGKPLSTGIDWARRDIRRAARKGGSVRISLRRGADDVTLELEARPRDVGMPLTYVDDGIGYIATDRFASSHMAATQMTRALRNLRDSSVHTIVFDVRGSQGGTMEHALRILELFATKGDTLARTWSNGMVVRCVVAKAHGMYRRMSVFVCVDSRTAGAAELLAASMQRNRMATVVGRTTRGQMTESVDYYLHGKIGMRLVTRQYDDMPDASVEPDIMLTLPIPDVGTCQRLVSRCNVLSYRKEWHEPTADLIDDAIVRLPSSIAVPNRMVIADAIYAGGARLFNLNTVMRRVILSMPRITKR